MNRFPFGNGFRKDFTNVHSEIDQMNDTMSNSSGNSTIFSSMSGEDSRVLPMAETLNRSALSEKDKHSPEGILNSPGKSNKSPEERVSELLRRTKVSLTWK